MVNDHEMKNEIQNQMETAGVYVYIYIHLGVILGLHSGHIRIMEKKMETTIVHRVHIGVIF